MQYRALENKQTMTSPSSWRFTHTIRSTSKLLICDSIIDVRQQVDKEIPQRYRCRSSLSKVNDLHCRSYYLGSIVTGWRHKRALEPCFKYFSLSTRPCRSTQLQPAPVSTSSRSCDHILVADVPSVNHQSASPILLANISLVHFKNETNQVHVHSSFFSLLIKNVQLTKEVSCVPIYANCLSDILSVVFGVWVLYLKDVLGVPLLHTAMSLYVIPVFLCQCFNNNFLSSTPPLDYREAFWQFLHYFIVMSFAGVTHLPQALI